MRFQLDMSDARYKQLEDLMVRCDVDTKKELMSYALSILEWAVEETERGHDVAAIDRKEEKFSSLRMPILDAVKRRMTNGQPVKAL
jgi:hypothetical protein